MQNVLINITYYYIVEDSKKACLILISGCLITGELLDMDRSDLRRFVTEASEKITTTIHESWN